MLDYVIRHLAHAKAGRSLSNFPTFVLQSDSDGEWSVADCQKLQVELDETRRGFESSSSRRLLLDWQKVVAIIGLRPQNAFESFIDVDGEFLLERLQSLVKDDLACQLSILFQ